LHAIHTGFKLVALKTQAAVGQIQRKSLKTQEKISQKWRKNLKTQETVTQKHW
jgi:hypothetical protein